MIRYILPVALLFSTAFAQTTPRLVRALGEAVVSAAPDQAKITVAVITRAQTAAEASQQNATEVQTLLAQLRQVLGQDGDLKTVGYSLTPVYNYPKDSGQVLAGYSATNSIQVTAGDLTAVGRIIDTAIAAGADNVSGLYFTVKDPEPLRAEALSRAAAKAIEHAQAIAAGLKARTGAVISAQEGSVVTYTPTRDAGLAAATTPIEAGLVEIRATVTVEVELQS